MHAVYDGVVYCELNWLVRERDEDNAEMDDRSMIIKFTNYFVYLLIFLSCIILGMNSRRENNLETKIP